MSQILRAFSATVDDVDNSDRSIVSKISVGSVDRYSSLILPRGIDLKAYVKNPIVLFEHGKDVTRGAVPIGRNVWVKLNNQGNTLIAKTRFARDSFSDLLYSFYSDGTMTGWSVRLLPVEQGGAPTREEARAYPGMDKCDIVYRSTELLEYSAVAVGGNKDATTDPELRSMFSEAQLESLSTLVMRGFWTPTEEVKPLIEPIIERMSESNGMASGGALVADDDDDEEDEDDDDSDSADPEKKKKAKKRSMDDGSDESDDSIAMSADDAEVVPDAVESSDDDVTRDGPPDESRDRVGKWTDGHGEDSEKSKATRRKSRPSLYDENGKEKKKVTRKDVEKLEKLQERYNKSPLYKTPDLKDPKTGETFHVIVAKHSGYNEDPQEKKYFIQVIGSKSGRNDGEGTNSLKAAAKKADSRHRMLVKDGLKPVDAKRSAPDEVTPDSEDDFIGEWFGYLDEAIVDRSAPEIDAAPATETASEPAVDPLAGLPPLVGRSLEDVTRRNKVMVDAWVKSNEAMIREFEGWVRGEA